MGHVQFADLLTFGSGLGKIKGMARKRRVHFTLVPVGEREDGSMERMDAWFEVPLDGDWETAPWRAAYRVKPRGDRVEVLEVRVFPHLGSPGVSAGDWNVETGVVPEGGMTARLIRDRLVLGKHIHEMLPALLNQNRETFPPGLFGDWLDRLGYPSEVRRGPGARSKRGPKGRTDRELAEIAAIYVKVCSKGGRAHVQTTAKKLGLPATVVRDALHRARKRGLLTSTMRGLSGGKLTEYGEQVLAETESQEQASSPTKEEDDER